MRQTAHSVVITARAAVILTMHPVHIGMWPVELYTYA